jgi:hypothetical protein
MREEDFQKEIDRLNNNLQGPKYSVEQTLRIRTYVIDLPHYEFRKMVNDVFDTEKYKPTPKKFRDLASLVSKKYRKVEREDIPENPNCRICADTGIAYAFSKTKKSEETFYCSCHKGAYPIQDRNLPRWKKEFEKYYNLDPRYPFEPKYYQECAKLIRVPGVAAQLLKNGVTGESSDFNFVFDEDWQKKNKGSQAGLINLFQGLKNDV